jgi:hypothetical protein
VPPFHLPQRARARLFVIAPLTGANHGRTVERRAVVLRMVLAPDALPARCDPIHLRSFEDFVTTKPQGTGLGLPVARTILERGGVQARAFVDCKGTHWGQRKLKRPIKPLGGRPQSRPNHNRILLSSTRRRRWLPEPSPHRDLTSTPDSGGAICSKPATKRNHRLGRRPES